MSNGNYLSYVNYVLPKLYELSFGFVLNIFFVSKRLL